MNLTILYCRSAALYWCSESGVGNALHLLNGLLLFEMDGFLLKLITEVTELHITCTSTYSKTFNFICKCSVLRL